MLAVTRLVAPWVSAKRRNPDRNPVITCPAKGSVPTYKVDPPPACKRPRSCITFNLALSLTLDQGEELHEGGWHLQVLTLWIEAACFLTPEVSAARKATWPEAASLTNLSAIFAGWGVFDVPTKRPAMNIQLAKQLWMFYDEFSDMQHLPGLSAIHLGYARASQTPPPNWCDEVSQTVSRGRINTD